MVIGGTRFIGAHLVRRLHDAGAEVTLFHRGLTANPILPDVAHVLDEGAEYPIVRFPDALRRDWDLVVHMVAMGAADAEAAVGAFRGRAGRLLLVSSCDVYRAYGRLTRAEPGEAEPVPLGEEAPLRSVLFPYRGMEPLLEAYARHYEKILAEAAVRAADGLDWTILRLPKVYGPEDNGDLASVRGYRAAPGWRWTHGHVTNVAAAIALAATHPAARCGLFNVGEAETPTMGERLAGFPPEAGDPPPLPDFDFRQPLVLDSGRIRRELGYADVVDEAAAMRELAAGLGVAGVSRVEKLDPGSSPG
nr:NAD-dependent epimerase/dehydratase family protein [Sandaracinobacteroides sayramensis]